MNSNTKKFWSNRNANSTVLYIAFISRKDTCCHIFMSGSTVYPPPSVILLFFFLQTGEELIDGNHYASHEIEARIETLTHTGKISVKVS